MAGFQCPYCQMVMPISDETCKHRYPSFETDQGFFFDGTHNITLTSCLETVFYKCPNCGQYSVQISGIGGAVRDIKAVNIRPNSLAKQFPDYIPEAIRNDYEEACAIVNLSPKASATLSRRCLQGMIRNFWDITESSLYHEIDALKGKIPVDLWESINALRQLGNIGAHMEKDTDVIVDIDPNEAEALIKLIELLMKEWYINREDRSCLFSKIINTNNEKQSQRKKTE